MPVHRVTGSPGGRRSEPLCRYVGVIALEKREAAAAVANAKGLEDDEAAAVVIARPPRLEGGRPFIPTGLAACTVDPLGVDGPAKVVDVGHSSYLPREADPATVAGVTCCRRLARGSSGHGPRAACPSAGPYP